MDLMQFTAVELGKMIKNKEVTVKDCVLAAFSQIEAVEGQIHSFVTLDKEGALKRAEEVQAKIDSGNETIVGLNKYRLEKEDPLQILSIDNTAVRNSQIERLEKLRKERNADDCRQALEALTNAAEDRKNGNVLARGIGTLDADHIADGPAFLAALDAALDGGHGARKPGASA